MTTYDPDFDEDTNWRTCPKCEEGFDDGVEEGYVYCLTCGCSAQKSKQEPIVCYLPREHLGGCEWEAASPEPTAQEMEEVYRSLGMVKGLW